MYTMDACSSHADDRTSVEQPFFYSHALIVACNLNNKEEFHISRSICFFTNKIALKTF